MRGLVRQNSAEPGRDAHGLYAARRCFLAPSFRLAHRRRCASNSMARRRRRVASMAPSSNAAGHRRRESTASPRHFHAGPARHPPREARPPPRSAERRGGDGRRRRRARRGRVPGAAVEAPGDGRVVRGDRGSPAWRRPRRGGRAELLERSSRPRGGARAPPTARALGRRVAAAPPPPSLRVLARRRAPANKKGPPRDTDGLLAAAPRVNPSVRHICRRRGAPAPPPAAVLKLREPPAVTASAPALLGPSSHALDEARARNAPPRLAGRLAPGSAASSSSRATSRPL